MTSVLTQGYNNVKIIMTGTIVEFVLYRCRNFRFWCLFYAAFENVCMSHFFCSILS